MNILSLLGSSREKGNTSIMLDSYIRGINESGKESNIEEIFIQNKDIKYCRACNSCKMEERENQCVINDDMKDIYSSIIKSEVIIFATPIYVFNISAQLKVIFDRMYALKTNVLKGKKIVLLTTYGDIDESNSGVKNVVEYITKISQTLEMKFIQNYNISTYNNEILKDKKILEKIELLGNKLWNYNKI